MATFDRLGDFPKLNQQAKLAKRAKYQAESAGQIGMGSQ
jgi:hypothetical protein